IGLLDPRKMHDFYGSRAQLGRRCRSRAQNLRSAWHRLSTSEIGDVGKYTAEQVSGHRHLGHLEGGVTGMADQLRSDLHHPVTENSSKLSFLGRCGMSPQHGAAETVARPQGKAFSPIGPCPFKWLL